MQASALKLSCESSFPAVGRMRHLLSQKAARGVLVNSVPGQHLGSAVPKVSATPVKPWSLPGTFFSESCDLSGTEEFFCQSGSSFLPTPSLTAVGTEIRKNLG